MSMDDEGRMHCWSCVSQEGRCKAMVCECRVGQATLATDDCFFGMIQSTICMHTAAVS